MNHTQTHREFSVRDVARFWAPLSFNWQLMAFEFPFITSPLWSLDYLLIYFYRYNISVSYSSVVDKYAGTQYSSAKKIMY